MLLDLTTLKDDRTPLRFAVPAEAVSSADDFVAEAPVHLDGELVSDGRGTYRLNGRVTGTLEVPCSRCAEPYTTVLDAPVEVTLRPVAELEAAEEHEVRDDDLATEFYRDETLDIAGLVREQCLLALPMKTLCRPDCRGLCPQCGANLNLSTCACDNTWVDPRLAALKALVPDPPGE